MTTKEQFIDYFPDSSNRAISAVYAHENFHNGNLEAASNWLKDYLITDPRSHVLEFIQNVLGSDHELSIKVEGVRIDENDYVVFDNYEDVEVTIEKIEASEINHEF